MKYKKVKPVFQGDIGFFAIDNIPSSVKKVEDEKGKYIVAHSETGHHHVIEKSPNIEVFQDVSDALSMYLNVIRDDVKVEHLRSFDTHQPITLPRGKYITKRQREHTPEGWRIVAD